MGKKGTSTVIKEQPPKPKNHTDKKMRFVAKSPYIGPNICDPSLFTPLCVNMFSHSKEECESCTNGLGYNDNCTCYEIEGLYVILYVFMIKPVMTKPLETSYRIRAYEIYSHGEPNLASALDTAKESIEFVIYQSMKPYEVGINIPQAYKNLRIKFTLAHIINGFAGIGSPMEYVNAFCQIWSSSIDAKPFVDVSECPHVEPKKK
jgi:hypothetical protein